MEDSPTKKILISVLGLVVLIVAGSFLYKVYWNKLKSDTPIVNEEPKLEVKYYPKEEVPGDIPKDMPFEEGAVLLRNEMLTSNTSSQIQYARGYYSKKTVEENYEIYLKYFTDNDYRITNKFTQKDFATINARKTGVEGDMQVSISRNTLTEDITVQVIYYK